MSQQRKGLPVFLSFRAALTALHKGEATADDLAKGVFYFRCTRDHVMNPGCKGDQIEAEVRAHPAQHEQLKAALLVAEAEGRVAWRQADQGSSFKQLHELLVAHGLKGLPKYAGMFYGPEDRYQAVADACIESRLIPGKVRLIR
ncbi:MAG: hypothetical protein K2W82_17360 [Candidatus Obscuribacterales bacterium]|nr:hypothetical protein [Candidatus Obscuribacterales bacterium]